MSQFIEMFGGIQNDSKWPLKSLEELCDMVNGYAFKSNKYSDAGYSIIRIANVQKGTIDDSDKVYYPELYRSEYSDSILNDGDIVVSLTGNVGRVGVICNKHLPAALNQRVQGLRIKDTSLVNPQYLFSLLNLDDFENLCIKNASGSAQLNLSTVWLRNCKIVCPPIEKQELFASIAVQADKSEFVGCKSQFIEMFGSMTTTPVKDYIDDSFPGEWGTEDKDGNGVKVIRTTNFTNSGKLNLEDVVTRNIEERKVSRKQIKKYDTILERSGGTADNPVGRVVLFEEDEQYLCNNFTQVLRFKNIDPRFAFYSLYYFYQTNKTAIRSMGSKTTGIQNLNMGKYQEIGVPNASDEQQEAFVSIAEQADKSEFELRKSIEAIDQVIKSLINGIN